MKKLDNMSNDELVTEYENAQMLENDDTDFSIYISKIKFEASKRNINLFVEVEKRLNYYREDNKSHNPY